jgi:hypothetical protein
MRYNGCEVAKPAITSSGTEQSARLSINFKPYTHVNILLFLLMRCAREANPPSIHQCAKQLNEWRVIGQYLPGGLGFSNKCDGIFSRVKSRARQIPRIVATQTLCDHIAYGLSLCNDNLRFQYTYKMKLNAI